jgi:hypothetical protein
MATWRADVFVNSQVGRITTEVEAATFSGAQQQIYAKHGDVQSITNLRQVSNSSSSSSGSGGVDAGASMGLLAIVAGIWVLVTFTPWILMGLGGALGTWIGEKLTGQSIEEYTERSDDEGHGKAAIVLALALLCGGIGFVQGAQFASGFDSTPKVEQTQSK